ncbi:SCP2 sterol-binding domain-containing protein [Kutzneria sp. NPDC052558]|uniref:SCP2 sterol-binding domain-containing protein n=1 Tax=Kutzneria sp. NPDC052558 TaxID=3364121 RepID=UPI0037CAE6FE
MRFLSPEWTAEVAAVLAENTDILDSAEGTDCRLNIDVTSSDTDTARMNLRITPDGVVLRPGPDSDPDVRLSYDYDTAARIARRELMPGEAFRAGLITTDGDLGKLTGLEEVLDEVAWAMNEVECVY